MLESDSWKKTGSLLSALSFNFDSLFRDSPATSWPKGTLRHFDPTDLSTRLRVLSEHASCCDLRRVAVLTHLDRTGELVATS